MAASFKADGPPCFTRQILADMVAVREAMRALYEARGPADFPIDYVALASKKAGVFNLGGDLAMFAQSIRGGEREALRAYAHACIDVMHGMISAYGLPVVTVAVIAGQALGGGFESALAQDVLFAERTATLGVPEIAFNTFPGMGAITLLTRRVGAALTEWIVSSGETFSAEALFERDVVDVLTPEGCARQTALAWMVEGGRVKTARRLQVMAARRRCFPVTFEELIGIVDVWTDCSCSVTPRDLRHMDRLVAAQKRMAA